METFAGVNAYFGDISILWGLVSKKFAISPYIDSFLSPKKKSSLRNDQNDVNGHDGWKTGSLTHRRYAFKILEETTNLRTILCAYII